MSGVLGVRNFRGVVVGVSFFCMELECFSHLAYLAASPSWQKASGSMLQGRAGSSPACGSEECAIAWVTLLENSVEKILTVRCFSCRRTVGCSTGSKRPQCARLSFLRMSQVPPVTTACIYWRTVGGFKGFLLRKSL